uniref:Putative endonuclease/exonuclease/phosphatase n=1 Tax=Helianthus annuus TaxID=4232 RepID=A0A251U587_HELAN
MNCFFFFLFPTCSLSLPLSLKFNSFLIHDFPTFVCNAKRSYVAGLVSSTKILTKTLSSNFVTDFPTSPESFLHLPTLDPEHVNITQNYNIFVSTWNVGGVAPTGDLNIDDLLDTHNTRCDIYVQEVVPLTTPNVLGLAKKKVSKKWNSLIRKTLNKKSRMSSKVTKPNTESSDEFRCLVSKRMVGLLISVWLRNDLYQLVQNPNVSCVGCGIMGRLGTSHLASGGEKVTERLETRTRLRYFHVQVSQQQMAGLHFTYPKGFLTMSTYTF